MSNNSTKFIVISDLHCTDKLSIGKQQIINRIINELTNADLTLDKINMVIIPGDLTDNGYDGEQLLGWKFGGDQDQLDVLIKDVIEPLEKYTKVYICAGNHDEYVKPPRCRKPVLNYIIKRHGSLRYEIKMSKKNKISSQKNMMSSTTCSLLCCNNKTEITKKNYILKCLCLNIYPDEISRAFLKLTLECNPSFSYIIIFHYNPIGPYSEFWNDDDKQAFLDIISGYHIIAIITGHIHISTLLTWTNPKTNENYPIIIAAGDKFALCEFNFDTSQLITKFL